MEDRSKWIALSCCTLWGYLKLEERSAPQPASIDWWGNLTFALGLVLAMVSVTYETTELPDSDGPLVVVPAAP
jgi:hypothetical protein